MVQKYIPSAVMEYRQNMGYVDCSDQMRQYYSSLRKNKMVKKVGLCLFHTRLLNSYSMFKMFHPDSNFCDFSLEIVEHQISIPIKNSQKHKHDKFINTTSNQNQQQDIRLMIKPQTIPMLSIFHLEMVKNLKMTESAPCNHETMCCLLF